MASKKRYAVLIFPIVLGSVLLAIGLNDYQQATTTITVKSPPTFGIMAFSSMDFNFNALRAIFNVVDVKKNEIRVLHTFSVTVDWSLFKEAFGEEQVFGFQFPYHIHHPRDIVVKGWSDLQSEPVTIEIIEHKVHVEGETSIFYFKFTPLEGINHYDFEVWFNCREAIIQETFTTYSLYVPICISNNNVFQEYFSNLNFAVHPIPFEHQHGFEIALWLPPSSRVIEVFPPLLREIISSHPSDEGYQPVRLLTWFLSLDGRSLGPSPQPKSKVMRITFEMSEDVDRHNRLLFDSGLWIGIGVSNLIAGCYGILRHIVEKPERSE